ncbi:MAG: DUF3617 family protein [Gammaproteobacteria bacterium]
MRLPIVTLLFLAATAAVAQGQPGNLWDTTTSMEMAGMKMPGQKRQFCAPANAEGPAAMAGDDRCQMSDIKSSPGKFSYKVTCPEGSGTGEMTYQGKDSYTSKMTMTTDGDTMTMVTTGKRLGACDASQPDKQTAALLAQSAAMTAKSCESGAESMQPYILTTSKCDAKYKKQLCERVNTKAGFRDVAQRQSVGDPMVDAGTLPEVAKFCGTKAETIRARLCSDASKADDLDFIVGQCPAQAQPIAQRECAGRSFSTPPAPKYRDFCSRYGGKSKPGVTDDAAGAERAVGEAAAGATPETPAAPETATKPTDMMKEGAKRLKGLFGR